uniref:Uncharacterized protein n=1 Tax=Rousettus aegyptiacus TaxID=9407 RepID=A0A7J8INJ4_ROUAE|nr:hypothetical protein HJG63_013263 [Rousettus aegyptiacus]
MSAKPQEKAALEPETGAMPEKRAGAQAAGGSSLQGFSRPSVYHAAVVIFLEFFAWGLLTTPMLTVLHETFPQHTFLMNGLIQGVKKCPYGILGFHAT